MRHLARTTASHQAGTARRRRSIRPLSILGAVLVVGGLATAGVTLLGQTGSDPGGAALADAAATRGTPVSRQVTQHARPIAQAKPARPVASHARPARNVAARPTTAASAPATPATAVTPVATATAAAGGSGGQPPTAFWGDTATIPAAKNVLEVKLVNQTNGQYPDNEVYWSFDGTEKSIAQQPYIDMPANSSGRLYFYLGSPNSQYFDFIEFTVGADSINVDTTRVDRWGLPLAILAHSHDSTDQAIGDAYNLFTQSRTQTFAAFQAAVPAQFQELATINAPYGIPAPGSDPSFQPGGKYAGYFTGYAAANGDPSDTTAEIFGCGGTLSANPTLCAGLNRHVAQLPAAEQSNPANFYQAGPANYYAQFWHENAINGKQYGFPYDDDAGQSSDITVANPQYMVVAVGW